MRSAGSQNQFPEISVVIVKLGDIVSEVNIPASQVPMFAGVQRVILSMSGFGVLST